MKIKLTTLAICLIVSFLAGAGVMRWWDYSHGKNDLVKMQAIFNTQRPTDSLLAADLKESELAEGIEEKESSKNGPRRGTELPSQLSPIHLEGVSEIYAYKKEADSDLEEQIIARKKYTEPVDLSDAQGKVPAATDNAQQAKMPTNITMIEVPVKARVISSSDDYKDFKRVARGSYPTADFAKEQVLVLESESNLPDKVFEIADVKTGTENIVVLYRVNVFGLDHKTNTHSAVKMPKTDLPVVLQQVL